jgi:predicted ArsR family transcriptional regulator
MTDGYQDFFGWITPLLARPLEDVCAIGSEEHEIVTALRDEWGQRDTAELLRALTARYGDRAPQAVRRWLEAHIVKDWAAIGRTEARPGSEIEDFIRLLWAPLTGLGFEFSITRTAGSAAFRVTRCPVHELASRSGLPEWCDVLACSTDPHTATAFSPRIAFSRTKTLIAGHECCDHRYDYRPVP